MSDASHAAPKGPPWGLLGFIFVVLAVGGTLIGMFFTELALGASNAANIFASASGAFSVTKVMFHDFAIWIGTIILGLLALAWLASGIRPKK